MSDAPKKFLPALRFEVLTPLYDAAVALTIREHAIQEALLQRAAIAPGQRVLDLGCGTGALALSIAAAVRGVEVVGLDPDPKILAIAARKARRADLAIDWVQGNAIAPPFPAGSFDRVVSRLMFHHLTLDEKRQALRAAQRLLRPGGWLHIADFGRPHSTYTRIAAAAFQYFDGVERTAANLSGLLPQLVVDAGFRDVDESAPWTTAFGTLTFVRGRA